MQSTQKKLLSAALLAFASLLCMPSTAWAGCIFSAGDAPGGAPHPNRSFTSTIPARQTLIEISNDMPNGTTFYKQTTNIGWNYMLCKSVHELSASVGDMYPYLGNNLYQSSTSGIAFKIRLGNTAAGALPFTHSSPLPNAFKFPYLGNEPTVELELIKIGPLSDKFGETISSSNYLLKHKLIADGMTWYPHHLKISSPGITVRLKRPTCTVTTPIIHVPLGENISRKLFNGVGSKTPAKKFDIQLNCSVGEEGTSRKAKFTIDDASNPGITKPNLSLSKDSANTTSLEINLLYNDRTIRTNEPTSTTLPLKNGLNNLTFTTYLRQIRNTAIKGGTVKAKATFTMSYE